MTPVRILLVDDHIMVREGARKILEREADLKVVAEAGDGRETIVLVEREHPDMDVLRLAAKCLGNRQIAETLVLCPRTVQSHMANIFGKLRVASRTEAVMVGVPWLADVGGYPRRVSLGWQVSGHSHQGIALEAVQSPRGAQPHDT